MGTNEDNKDNKVVKEPFKPKGVMNILWDVIIFWTSDPSQLQGSLVHYGGLSLEATPQSMKNVKWIIIEGIIFMSVKINPQCA